MCQENGEGGQRAGNGRCITAVEAELGGLMLFDLFSTLQQGHRHCARTKSAIPVESDQPFPWEPLARRFPHGPMPAGWPGARLRSKRSCSGPQRLPRG